MLPNFARRLRRGGRSPRISPGARGHMLEDEFLKIMRLYRSRYPSWLLKVAKSEDYLEPYKVDMVVDIAERRARFYFQIKSSEFEMNGYLHHRYIPCALINPHEKPEAVFSRTLALFEKTRSAFLARFAATEPEPMTQRAAE